MTLDEVRDYADASPFQPFTLRLSSGRELTVEHPEFMHVPPVEGLVAVWDREGHMHALDAAHVVEIDLSPVKKTSGRKRRR